MDRSDAAIKLGKADRLNLCFSKEKGSPMVYSALFNIFSNFHANTKYVKYAHNLGITTVKLHEKGRNTLKNARRGAAFKVQIKRNSENLISFIRNCVKLNRLNVTGSSH